MFNENMHIRIILTKKNQLKIWIMENFKKRIIVFFSRGYFDTSVKLTEMLINIKEYKIYIFMHILIFTFQRGLY